MTSFVLVLAIGSIQDIKATRAGDLVIVEGAPAGTDGVETSTGKVPFSATVSGNTVVASPGVARAIILVKGNERKAEVDLTGAAQATGPKVLGLEWEKKDGVVTLHNRRQKVVAVIFVRDEKEEKRPQAVYVGHPDQESIRFPIAPGQGLVCIQLGEKPEFGYLIEPTTARPPDDTPKKNDGFWTIADGFNLAPPTFTLSPKLRTLWNAEFDDLVSNDSTGTLDSSIRFRDLDSELLWGGRFTCTLGNIGIGLEYVTGDTEGQADHTVTEFGSLVAQESLRFDGKLSLFAVDLDLWLLGYRSGDWSLKLGLGADFSWSELKIDRWNPDPLPTWPDHLKKETSFQFAPTLSAAVDYQVGGGLSLGVGTQVGWSVAGDDYEAGLGHAQFSLDLSYTF